MEKTLSSLRSLAATNAALMHSAQQSDEQIRAAAEQELEKINAQIAQIPAHEAITDPLKDKEYRQLVFRRAQLHKLLADA
jgi:hypothetical protein